MVINRGALLYTSNRDGYNHRLYGTTIDTLYITDIRIDNTYNKSLDL